MSEYLLVNNVSKYFRGIQAISNFTMGLAKGEIIGLIGPNGAGKTTLFNLVTGFLIPDRGDIKFKGEAIQGFRPHKIVRKGIAKTFQIPKSFHSLSCFENVVVSMISNFNPTKKEEHQIEERAYEIMEVVGLQGKEEMFPTALSQGDLKHLEIARALATDPEILLLDEPFAGLSVSEVVNGSLLIEALHKKGITIIIVDHKLRDLMKIVKRVVALNFGEKIADGTPEEVINNQRVIEAYLGPEG